MCKCDLCGTDSLEPSEVRDLEWSGLNIYSKDKTEALILLPPKKIVTCCGNCASKIEAKILKMKMNPRKEQYNHV